MASVSIVWSKEDLVAGTRKTLSNVVPSWAMPQSGTAFGVIDDASNYVGLMVVGGSTKSIAFLPSKNATYIDGTVTYICVE